MRHQHHILIGLCVLLASCGSGLDLVDGDELSSRPSPIVNGSPDPGHPAVGLLKASSGYGTGICTATLIGTKTVLTAAHCVQGKSAATFTVGGKIYQAVKISVHPSYSYSVINAYDLAVVILGQPVSGVTPHALSKSTPQVGETITIVGFGITKTGWSNSGTKRVTTNTISSVKSQYFRFSGASGGKGNVCSGDSGGPSFRVEGGVEVLMGVHSTASQPCGYAGNDMRVDAFHDWISAQAGGDLVGKDNKPPAVSITDPAGGTAVSTSLTVKVTASDDGSGLASVKLFVDGKLSGSRAQSPAQFSLTGLSAGAHNIRADAVDKAGNTGSMLINITVKKSTPAPKPPPAPKQPPAPTPPATSPGSFGSSCTSDSECSGGYCVHDSYLQKNYCTKSCDQATPCPSGADCIPVGASASICGMPAGAGLSGDGEVLAGGCSTARAQAGALWPLVLLLGLLLVRRRIGPR